MARRDDYDDRDEPIVRRDGGGNATLWVLLAGSAAGLLCLGLAGVGLFWLVPRGAPRPDVQAGPQEPARPAKYTRDEFRALVVGKTEDEVIAAVGRPTTTSNVAGDVWWNYEQTTYDPVTGKVDMRTSLLIVGGKVSRVDF